MAAFEIELSGKKLGADVLVHVARNRLTGTLSWSHLGTRASLVLHQGRPGRAAYNDGAPIVERKALVAFTRGFAILAEGSCQFIPQGGVEPPTPPVIDTLGEVLVALVQTTSPALLATVWQARGRMSVIPTDAFPQLSSALKRVGGIALDAPRPGSTLASLVAAGTVEHQRSWLAVLILGGLLTSNPEGARASVGSSAPGSGSGHRSASGIRPPTSSVSSARPVTGAPSSARPVTGAPSSARPLSQSPVQGGAPTPGARGAAPSELPSDPAALRLYQEIELAHQKEAEQSHYEFMGVARNADAATIRSAYFERAKLWHSDRFAGLGLPQGAIEHAAQLFARLEEAYRVLSDQNERKTYDYILDRKAKGLPTDPGVIMEAEGLFKRGQGLVRRGQAGAAEPILRQALDLNPGEAEFLVYHGFALYSAQGRSSLQQAREEIQKGIEMNPHLDAGPEFLGRIARLEENLAEAQKQLKKALQLNPNNIDAARELRLMTMRGSKDAGSEKGGGLLSKILKR